MDAVLLTPYKIPDWVISQKGENEKWTKFSDRCGLSTATIDNLRRGCIPLLSTLEVAAQNLGYVVAYIVTSDKTAYKSYDPAELMFRYMEDNNLGIYDIRNTAKIGLYQLFAWKQRIVMPSVAMMEKWAKAYGLEFFVRIEKAAKHGNA